MVLPRFDSGKFYSFGMAILFLILILIIIAAGSWFYLSQEQQFTQKAVNDLTSIAILKTNQIADWRDERRFDARGISSNLFFIDGAAHYLAYGDVESRDKILSRFTELNDSPRYRNVMLLDPESNVRISLDPAVTGVDPVVKGTVRDALSRGEPVMTDLYREPFTGNIQMELVAPLRVTKGNATTPVGAVVMTIDPRAFLYPLIQSWPGTSSSAETLLVEREGDHVLFLNELRHENNAALNLTIPLSRIDVPAVNAVLGTTGAFTGKDYRGVDVISVLEPVPGSPWYMVAKVDSDEAFAEWRASSGLIIALIIGALAAVLLVIGLLWQHRQSYYHRAMFEADLARKEQELQDHLKLQESEERFREIFDHSTAGKSLTSATDGTLLRINPAFADMLGYSVEELQQDKWVDITYPDDIPESRECIRLLLAGERTRYRMEKRYIHKSGAILWGDVSTTLLRDSSGKPRYLITTILDITERKQIEHRLKETNEYLQNLITYANAPIIVWDPQFRITRFNHAFERLTGKSEQEVIGKDIGILFPEGSRKTSLDLIRKTLSGERWETVEIPILHVSGEIRTVLWNSANIVDPEGRIISTIAQGQDVTERKNAEEHLRETTEYLQNLITYANAPIIVWDPQFRITRFNHAFEHLTGRAESDVLMKDIGILFPGGSRKTSLDLIRKTLSGERWETVEIPILHVSGEIRTVLWNSANIVDPEGRIISTIAQGHDITERKLTELQREALIQELEQKNAELERFTYTVSHDLKSPLITIQGFAGMLEDDIRDGDTELTKKDLQRITKAANQMQELLSDLLELSRIGRIISPSQTIPFGDIVQEAIDLLAAPVQERGITIEIDPDLPVVNVDRTRIREVMVNLVENAVKFMGEQEHPVIHIGVTEKKGVPVFFVRDNGIGIDPRYLLRIFNLFEKLDPSVQGTGVGLAIVKRIIEIHGGKIWAESEGPGKGTTFFFTLPVPGDAESAKNNTMKRGE